jgi:hypothetical protein
MRISYKHIVSPHESLSPLVFSGHLSGEGRTLSVRYTNGITDRVPVGLRGYFVYQPAAALQSYAKTGAIQLIERNRHGTITDAQLLQPPIILSESTDVSPHLARGRVFVRGVKFVGVVIDEVVSRHPFFSHPTGQMFTVPVGRDGRFSWHAPTGTPKQFTISLKLMDAHFGVLLDLSE